MIVHKALSFTVVLSKEAIHDIEKDMTLYRWSFFIVIW